MITPLLGRPRISSERLVTHRIVSRQGFWDYLANGAVVDGTKARDPGNTDDTFCLRPGLVMGKITSSGKYANSWLGTTSGALTSTGTSITVSAASAAEIVRRIGTSGTFKLTGPPVASGTVRSLTATYSAVDTSTGVVTITALGVNEVQTLTFGAAATGGTMRLRVPLANGTMVTTDAITWNATDATWLAAINTALDAATGVVGGIVATGAAPDTAITFTFSGTGYAALPQPSTLISVVVFPTSTTSATVVQTTAGVDGRFVTASLVQPTDGSESPLWMVPDGYGIQVPSDSIDTEVAQLPIGGVIDSTQLLPWPADASLKTWLRTALSNASVGKFTFSDMY